jgi:cytochrome c-type biogenesis protein CcmH/NrfF
MKRIQVWAEHLWYGLGTWTAMLYLAAASLVGVEVLLGFATAVPESFPVILLVLGVVYLVRRLRRRNRAATAGDRSDSEPAQLVD